MNISAMPRLASAFFGFLSVLPLSGADASTTYTYPDTTGDATVLSTNPKYGVAPTWNGLNAAAIFAALSDVPGSSPGSVVAGSSSNTLTLTPTGTNFTWFASLASAGAPTFNVFLGTYVWDGATTVPHPPGNPNGELFNAIDPGPATVTHISYTDGSGNTWNLYRDELYATPENNFWVTANPVPVPAAIWLFGSALAGLCDFGKRCKSSEGVQETERSGVMYDDPPA